MDGSAARSEKHVVISTGKSDWTSKIEQDEDGANLAHKMKSMMGLQRPFHRPDFVTAVTNADFEPNAPFRSAGGGGDDRTSAYVFPDFREVRDVRRSRYGDLVPFMRYVTADQSGSAAHQSLNTRAVHEAVILICGHYSRDARCGIMGPALKRQFERVLPECGYDLYTPERSKKGEAEGGDQRFKARVGLVSHIGGHKFAGNVIIYLPPGWGRVGVYGEEQLVEEVSPLAGKGIWYGRVEPKHVQGIVESTMRMGFVIEDLLRGVRF